MLVFTGLLAVSIAAGQSGGPAAPFHSDSSARTTYDHMVTAMRKAKALSWSADYRCSNAGREFVHTKYRIWLQKPNFARMDASGPAGDAVVGRMILDGSKIWVYWPGGKPAYPWDLKGKRAEEYKLYSHKFYKQQNAPLARHSIGHVATDLGGITCMTVVDPSTFHGYTDSLQRYIDGVRFTKDERIDGEDCTGIEVSFMKHQRSWDMWISKKDGLPRRLVETIRVNTDIVVTENWSKVTLNRPQSKAFFTWAPPSDWKLYKMPEIEEGLLAAGEVAPDFEVNGLDGGKIKLSDYKGKVVWLNKWRCG